MEFFNNEIEISDINSKKIIKTTNSGGKLVDVWVSDGDGEVIEGKEGIISYRISEEGIYGLIEHNLATIDGRLMEEITYSTYMDIFRFIKTKGYKLVRMWNYIPSIIKDLEISAPDIEIYRCFNSGRYKAFFKNYGEDRSKWEIPAASGVGSNEQIFKVEFFASNTEIYYIENRVQIPAYQYSLKYGKLPPVFSRGVIWKFKDDTILLASGTASILGEESVYIDNVKNQVIQSLQNLQTLASETNLQQQGISLSLTLENLVLLRVYYKYESDIELIESEIKKNIPLTCKVSLVKAEICRSNLSVEIEGVYRF